MFIYWVFFSQVQEHQMKMKKLLWVVKSHCKYIKNIVNVFSYNYFLLNMVNVMFDMFD